MADGGGQNGNEVEVPKPWFSRRAVVNALMYKINRRPRLQPTLFDAEAPGFFDHLVQALLFGEPVETGRRGSKRTWKLGNQDINEEEGILAGQIGFTRPGQHSSDQFDEVTQEWRAALEHLHNTSRAPFAINVHSRILYVLQAPGFTETVVPTVFRDLLNRGERDVAARSTEWDVEPLLNETDFLTWLREADAVESVTFEPKLPNPTGSDAFAPVWNRLEERRAKVLREQMVARSPEVGLQGLEGDRQTRAYMAMAGNGYGHVKGKRRLNGRTQTYDQRHKVRRRPLLRLPESWSEATRRLQILARGEPDQVTSDG